MPAMRRIRPWLAGKQKAGTRGAGPASQDREQRIPASRPGAPRTYFLDSLASP